jgi:hypothetical protein
MTKQAVVALTVLAGFLGGCSGDKRQEGIPDGNVALLACQDHPTEGASCDPLPEGLFCRSNSCLGGCESECRCREGNWHCSVTCRDYFSPIPIDCGTPPLCRETCQIATVLPDGGLTSIDGNFSSGYQYRMDFTPVDMSTLWGDKELRVSVGTGPPIEKSWLQDLAARISIRTWPEQDEVPAANTVADVSSSTWTGAIMVMPNIKLADRWYALRLSAVPFWIAPPATHVAPDGSYVARFRIGSEPQVAAVTFAGGKSKRRLYISPSEPVTAQQSPAAMVQVQSGGTSVACSDVAFVAGQAMPSLSFDCPSLTTFPDQITIGVGLASTTGVAFAPVTIAKADLILNSLCGTDCQTGVVP